MLNSLKDVRKGDLILSPGGKPSQVECVVKTICHQGKAELVELAGGLKVTPYHPVRVDGHWKFPCDLGRRQVLACPAVYSFVLREHHVMLINGTECVTLGHGFTGDAVVEHSYFGTAKVVDDLRQFSGWEAGHVELRSGCLVRDAQTGRVAGLAAGLAAGSRCLAEGPVC